MGISEGCCLSPSLVELTEDILKQLMELVFRLVCNGELSLARVLRKNILDKVEQKKQLRYTHTLKPLAARGVSARYPPAAQGLVRVWSPGAPKKSAHDERERDWWGARPAGGSVGFP